MPAHAKLAEEGNLIIQILYNETDIVDEDAIFKWADQLKKSSEPFDVEFAKKCQDFLTWLREAEEEDEEEEE